MLTGLAEHTACGPRTEFHFLPPYTHLDFERMQAILDDATMYGVAATRFISNDQITVVTIGAKA